MKLKLSFLAESKIMAGTPIEEEGAMSNKCTVGYSYSHLVI